MAKARVALVVNPSKPEAGSLALTLAQVAERAGAEVWRLEGHPLPLEALAGFDLCCVIGGDGTILGVVEAAALHQVPVLGVNVGRLGFIAHFTVEEAANALRQALAKELPIDYRSLVEVIDARGRAVRALNDIALRTESVRLARLLVSLNGQSVNDYYADGLLFCTPTGSTAYNLAAGGPIVHPGARVLVMTPINPHTLSNRAVVLDEQMRLRVEVRGDEGAVRVAADGRILDIGPTDFPLEICVCQQQRLPLLTPKDYSHFHILRRKLHWTGNTPMRLEGADAAPESSAQA